MWVPLPHAYPPFKKTLPLILSSEKKGREKLNGPGSQLLPLAFAVSEQKEKKGNVLSYHLMLQKWLQLICECWSYEKDILNAALCFLREISKNITSFAQLSLQIKETRNEEALSATDCFPGPQRERFLQSIPLCPVSKGAPKNRQFPSGLLYDGHFPPLGLMQEKEYQRHVLSLRNLLPGWVSNPGPQS